MRLKFVKSAGMIVLFLATLVFAGEPMFLHNSIQSVVIGEKAHIEFNLVSFDQDVYEARLFYREKGEMDYQSVVMRQEGYNLSTDINTQKLQPGRVEYYLAMQSYSGEVYFYPAVEPEQNPFNFELIAGESGGYNQAGAEILILSPEPADVVPQDELLIAVSVPDENLDIDAARTRFLIDGVNVSQLLERDGDLYMLVPRRMRTGNHNVEFKIFDSSGNLLGKKEWSFRVSSSIATEAAFSSRTNIYFDNRFQDIARVQDNYIRAGVNFEGSYKDLDIGLRLQYNSTPGYSAQNATRYSALMAYNFSSRTRMYLKGGDFSGNYDPLTFWNRRVLGFSGGLKSAWFDLDVSMGTTASAVEGQATITGGDTTITRYGTFKETFLSVRPVFNFGRYVSWGLNLINGKEDPGSIVYGANPRESLVMGTSLSLNLDNNRIRVKSSMQASIANKNARGKVDFDTLAKQYDLPASARSMADLLESSGLLTLSQGLAPIPSLAMQVDAYFSYFNHLLRLSYKSIDADYTTPGNPYLLKGLRGFYASDNVRLINNQVFLNLYFNSYTDNLSQKDAETANQDFGATLSYFPNSNLPSLTLSFGNQNRSNSADTTNSALYPEDNTTQRIGVSSSYSFETGALGNTATLSFSNFVRDDKISLNNRSSFNVISLGLRNSYPFPLVTRFGYSQTKSEFGAGSTATIQNITRFDGGVEYQFKGVARSMDIKPFANVIFQQISGGVQDYNRLNYSAGIYARSEKMGALSLRLDYIDYSDLAGVDWKDTIVNARYDLTF